MSSAIAPAEIITVVPPEFLENPGTRHQRHLFEGEPAENQLGRTGKRSNLINRQGLRLSSYFWPATGEAKGVVLVVHGHAAYLMEQVLSAKVPGEPPRYEGSWAETLNKAGWSVCGIDNQSCGFSEGLHGLRCYMDSFNDYVEDIVHFYLSLSVCQTPGFAGLPTFIMGTSLGGCLSVKAMLHKETDFQGVILLAPMLSLEQAAKTINPYIAALGNLISRWWPSLGVVPAAVNPLFPDLHAIWMADPLAWHGPTRARNATEYLQACKVVCAEMSSYTFPFICFHGDLDTLTDPAGSQKLFQESASKDKALHMVPKRWHVLMKEPGHEEILRQILDWMEARLPSTS
eukprot:jgi/Botrbrau1/12467/Bobra.0169s0014.1